MGRVLNGSERHRERQDTERNHLFCEEVMSVWCRLEGARARGYREALADVITHCRDNLGYSSVMTLEVPWEEPETETTKKSEDVK